MQLLTDQLATEREERTKQTFIIQSQQREIQLLSTALQGCICGEIFSVAELCSHAIKVDGSKGEPTPAKGALQQTGTLPKAKGSTLPNMYTAPKNDPKYKLDYNSIQVTCEVEPSDVALCMSNADLELACFISDSTTTSSDTGSGNSSGQFPDAVPFVDPNKASAFDENTAAAFSKISSSFTWFGNDMECVYQAWQGKEKLQGLIVICLVHIVLVFYGMIMVNANLSSDTLSAAFLSGPATLIQAGGWLRFVPQLGATALVVILCICWLLRSRDIKALRYLKMLNATSVFVMCAGHILQWITFYKSLPNEGGTYVEGEDSVEQISLICLKAGFRCLIGKILMDQPPWVYVLLLAAQIGAAAIVWPFSAALTWLVVLDTLSTLLPAFIALFFLDYTRRASFAKSHTIQLSTFHS